MTKGSQDARRIHLLIGISAGLRAAGDRAQTGGRQTV